LCVEKAKGWKAIGLEMGRMPEDCRDRFRNYIKCGDNRNLNKWSPEEEDKLKEIVNLFISEQQEAKMKSPIINWTIVSEKMGGKRSRIQCRYKWNKLLKREATQRAEKLGLDDRVWLLSKIQELGDLSQKEIEWEQLAAAHAKKYWTADDFKVAFNRMKGTVKDKKHKNLNEICHLLLQEAIQEAHRNNISVELPVVLQHFEESKPNDDGAPNAENIASAAINNSNRTTEDYVGWR
jgi:Myb-like DNA-binding protein REB1